MAVADPDHELTGEGGRGGGAELLGLPAFFTSVFFYPK